ncbi:hypothetical protein CVT25_013260 [Psilocybe cyanescens]|uniref:Uncharacterized protein n=1 Tax=Psilocybe cyanescens TaxID=93625 RepID=A0A409XSE5_PSICY|nr:hypothetical protein CVT25_013260 [Psilocybe cyanescens]
MHAGFPRTPTRARCMTIIKIELGISCGELLSLISGTPPPVPVPASSSTNSSCSGVAPSGYALVRKAPASPSALSVGSGAIQLVAAMQLPPNVHNALVLTSWRSIVPLQAAAKAIQRQTPLRHLCLAESPTLTPLTAQTAERITVPTSALVCSGVTGSISFGMLRNIVRYKRTHSRTVNP